jgi:hypothetical protein
MSILAWGARRIRWLCAWRTIARGFGNPLRFSTAGADAKIFGICFLALAPLYWAPLLVTEILPGLDLPFHLAVADMLGKHGSPASPYAAFYQGSLRVAPYAAHYFMLVVLGKVMNLLAAHKLIVALYVAAMPLSTASLLAACGRSRVPALLAFPLAYNLTLHYGFVSFALSLPVLLLLLAQVVKHLLSPPGRVRRSWLWTAAMALFLFLCHLQNFFYGVGAVLAFALLVSVPWRRRLLGASTLLPALAALAYRQFVASMSAAPQPQLAYVWALVKRHRLGELGGRTFLRDFYERLLLIPVHTLRGFADQVDVRACKALLLVIAVYLVAGLMAWAVLPWQKSLRRKPRMWPALLVVFAGALVAYLLFPHHLNEMGLTTFFQRFAVLVALTAIALVPAGLGRVSGVLRLVVPMPAVVMCSLYGHQLIVHYRLYAQETADFVEVMHKTPPGGKAVGLVFDRSSRVMRVESVFLGLPYFYVAMRPAPGSMTPLFYCGMHDIPCTATPAGAGLPNPWIPTEVSAGKSPPVFDYFFVRSPPRGTNPFGPYLGSVEVLAQSGTWIVYRKKPGAAIPVPAQPPPAKPVPAH